MLAEAVHLTGLVLAMLGAPVPSQAQQTTTTQLQYDAHGNPTRIIDPRGATTDQTYDALNRLGTVIQAAPAAGAARPQIGLTRDLRDAVTKVTDPRALVTTYTIDGLGVVSKEISPDRGTINRTYDAAGNVRTETDARGRVRTFSWDALNRLTAVSYSTGTATAFEWDGGSTAPVASRGLLTKITDESGSTAYTYDGYGRIVTKTQITGGKTRVVSYGWGTTGTATGKLVSVTYPSGNRVNLGYDSAGRLATLTLNPANATGTAPNTATTVTLLSGLQYTPAGAVAGWTWGGGTTVSRVYDLDGRLASHPLGHPAQGGLVRTLAYDAAGRITGYTHVNSAGAAQTAQNHGFGYDDLNRLTSWTQGTTSQTYAYDATGNRTSLKVGSTSYAYTVAATSNRLTATAGPAPAQANTFDAAGNITANGQASFTYSARGRRATTVVGTSTVSYLYNGLEQRVSKTGPGTLVPNGGSIYVYDEGGRLLGEYDPALNPVAETVYVGDTPVAVLKRTGVSGSYATDVGYVYADQIDTPRWIVRASDGKAVWRWDGADPFGAAQPNQNPSGLGVYAYNQRFPGQVYDAESGQHQNWHRDYDARVGRYAQADPIGLAGGINTYSYSGARPTSVVDPSGLFGVEDVLPENAPLVTWGRSIAAVAAYVTAVATGNEALRNVAVEELECNHSENVDSLATVLAMGRRGPFSKGGPPRDPRTANYLPLPEAVGPHSTLGTRSGRNGSYTQGATFDGEGRFVGRTDVTNHGRQDHTSPHWHPATGPNSVGGPQQIP